jgi:hypothetical protein
MARKKNQDITPKAKEAKSIESAKQSLPLLQLTIHTTDPPSSIRR